MRAAAGVPDAGTIIGEKYRVRGVVGGGGMGWLVEAEHLLLKTPVAIKLLQADTPRGARRLVREARAAQALSSENAVRVFDLGVHGAAPYIVMELLEGRDLASCLRDDGPFPVEEAVDCTIEACVAVAEAHALGIVHRDLKPANLFAARAGSQRLVKVLDFGISKVPEAPGEEDCEKTDEHTVLGSPYYMSPEQLRNPSRVDARTDVWALAVTLYVLLTGVHPFSGGGVREVTASIFVDPPRDARDLAPSVPEGLWAAIAAAMAKRPEERTPSVAAFVQDLVPFASKRGRLAAERAVAMAPPRPEDARREGSADAALEAASTLTGSTTGAADAGPELPSAPSAGRPRRAPRVLALAAIAVATGWILLRLASPRSAPVEAPAPPKPAAGGERPAPAPAASPPATAAVEPPAPSPPASVSPPTRRAEARRARTPAAPAPQPSTRTSSRPTDIDGVPIVE